MMGPEPRNIEYVSYGRVRHPRPEDLAEPAEALAARYEADGHGDSSVRYRNGDRVFLRDRGSAASFVIRPGTVVIQDGRLNVRLDSGDFFRDTYLSDLQLASPADIESGLNREVRTAQSQAAALNGDDHRPPLVEGDLITYGEHVGGVNDRQVAQVVGLDHHTNMPQVRFVDPRTMTVSDEIVTMAYGTTYPVIVSEDHVRVGLHNNITLQPRQ